jgi:hypothetical protein
MTTALHQLRRDVRRHALWLAAWAVLCVLPLGVLVLPNDETTMRALLNTVAPALRFVVFVLLTVLVVHEDPLVGSTAFWLTRPVGWRALFGSKLLFVGGLLVLPVAVADVVQMAATGVGTAYVLLAIPEIAFDWIVSGASVLALATLTATVPGFLGAILLLALLASAIHVLVPIVLRLVAGQSLSNAALETLGFLVAPVFDPEFDPWRAAPSMLASRALVTSALLAAAAFLVAALQYRDRRRPLAWATLAACLLVVLGLRSVWQWDLLALPQPAPVVDGKQVEQAHVSLDSHGFVESTAVTGSALADRTSVYGRARVEGIDLPLAAEVARLDGWLIFDDGSKVPLAGWVKNRVESSWDAPAVERLLGGARFVNLAQEDAGRVLVLRLDSTEYRRHAGSTGRLDGTAYLTLRSYRVAAELPARPDAAYDHDVEHAVITAIQRESGDCRLLTRETQVSLLLAPGRHAYRSMYLFRTNPDLLYVLRNRPRGEAFWPQGGTNFGFGWPSRTRIDETTAVASYRSNLASDPPLPRIDDAWIAGAELVRVEAETVGTVTAPIDATTFVLPSE